jgi:hypothetical protein
MKRLILLVLTITFIATTAFGQQEKEVKRVSGPRRQLATIIFSGLGGAVLGLSTLSFYGRPQEHLANIAIGFAFGVIAGTVLVTYKSATSREYFEDDGTGQTPPQGQFDPREKKWSLKPDVAFGEQGPLDAHDSRRESHYGALFQYNF